MHWFSSVNNDPEGIAGTIYIKKEKDPRKSGKVVGITLEDIHNNTWIIYGQVNDKLLARPIDFQDTMVSTTGTYMRTRSEYRTYKVEIVE